MNIQRQQRLLHATGALVLAGLLAACSTGSAPSGADEVRALVQQSLDLIVTGIEREDAVLASAPVSESFVMGSNVAIRYLDAGWSGQGVGALRGFLSSAFAVQQNISQELRIAGFALVGGVATVVVVSTYSSVRIDKMPPQNTNASGEDIMVFQLEDSGWRLVSWDQPAPPAEPPPA